MTVIPTKYLEFNSTNIEDDETPIWNPKTSYTAGTVRQYENKLFEVLGDNEIDPLVDFIFDETDPLNPNKTSVLNVVEPMVITRGTMSQETINGILYDNFSHLSTQQIELSSITFSTLKNGTKISVNGLVLNIHRWGNTGWHPEVRLKFVGLTKPSKIKVHSELDFQEDIEITNDDSYSLENIRFREANYSGYFDYYKIKISFDTVVDFDTNDFEDFPKIYISFDEGAPISNVDCSFSLKQNDSFIVNENFGYYEVPHEIVLCTVNNTVIQRKTYDGIENYIFDNATGLEKLSDSVLYNTGSNIYYNDFYIIDLSDEDKNNPVHFTQDLVNTYTTEALTPQDNPLYWLDLGYTNKYKMLDTSLNSETVYNGNMEMSFIVNKCDSIFLFGLYGTDVNITITSIDGATEYFNTDYDLENKNGGTFYNYFFNDFTYDDKFYETQLFTNIPIAYDVKVSITINALSGVSKCGLVAIGREYNIGGTTYGSSISSRDFSTKAENSQGEIYLEKGNIKRTNSLIIEIPNNMIDKVVELFDKFRATPIVFKGVDDIRTTVVFGIYNKYDVIIQTPSVSKLNIDYESLI